MSTEMIPFNATGGGLNTIPAHVAALFSEDEANLTARVTIDQLSYRGKIWRLVVDGKEHAMLKNDPDSGEQVPVPLVNVIVLDYNKKRSRSYYPGAFEEGKNAAPVCYSADGVTPDDSVAEKQSPTCAACPMSQKGSKITDDGKQSVACSQFKRLAIIPVGPKAGTHPVMLLRLAQTSMWDKDNKENETKGWFAWDQYMDMLRANQARHTANVATKIKFDTRFAYPKLLFSADRWLNADELTLAKSRIEKDAEAIGTILTGGAADGVAGTAPTTSNAAAENAPPADPAKAQVDAAAVEAAKQADAAKKAAAADAKKKAEAAKVKADKAIALKAQLAALEKEESDSEDSGFGGDEVTDVVDNTAKAAVPEQASPAAAASVAPKATVIEGATVELSSMLDTWDD